VSGRRLVLTGGAMAVLAMALAALTPAPGELLRVLAAPQAAADRSGADIVVLAGCAVLAGLAWSWGVLGLLLTAATALPGVLGAAAGLLQRALVPAGLRRAAAVALGVGLGLAGPWPAIAAAPTAPAAVPAAASPVPDWPAEPPAGNDPVPDRPGRPTPGAHVVVRGDCLWDIAESRLTGESGRPPTAREVVAAVQAWWQANSEVIGSDPDLILPGQVLHPPNAP
jgi:hypothetical protein